MEVGVVIFKAQPLYPQEKNTLYRLNKGFVKDRLVRMRKFQDLFYQIRNIVTLMAHYFFEKLACIRYMEGRQKTAILRVSQGYECA